MCVEKQLQNAVFLSERSCGRLFILKFDWSALGTFHNTLHGFDWEILMTVYIVGKFKGTGSPNNSFAPRPRMAWYEATKMATTYFTLATKFCKE